MKALFLTGLALAIATGFALPLAGSAEAAMGGALPSIQFLPVENAQFFFLGHNFCWYDDGWQGPGWYWCGYAWNNGQGWGGREGWNGWSRGSHAAAPRAPSHVGTKSHVAVSHVTHVTHVTHASHGPSGGKRR
jgi:hypothetical protein